MANQRARKLPDLPTIVDHLRGHALWYLHPHEHGPDSPIGTWLWRLAERMEDDHLAASLERIQRPELPPVPQQRRREVHSWAADVWPT